VNGSATSKAEFTLPVPMGSPQNYYGVGTFLKSTPTTNTSSSTANSPGQTDWETSGSVPSTVWTTPANANGTSDTNYAVSGSASGSAQQWQNFSLTTGATPEVPVAGTGQVLTITGLELELRDLLTGSGTSTTCQLQAALSWNGGS